MAILKALGRIRHRLGGSPLRVPLLEREDVGGGIFIKILRQAA